MHIEPITADLSGGPWAAVVITSANALVGLEADAQRQALTPLPLIAVGDRSAGAARKAGFADVTSAGGAAHDLVRLLASLPLAPEKPLLYLAGADRACDLAAELTAAGLAIDTRLVYRATPVRQLPEAAQDMIAAGRIAGVMHYSRRTADAYVALAVAQVGEQALKPAQFCLSGRIAEALTAAGARDIRIAAHPTEQSLLQLVDAG